MRKLRLVDFRKKVEKGVTSYFFNEEILPVAKKLYCSVVDVSWTIDIWTLKTLIAEHNKHVYIKTKKT